MTSPVKPLVALAALATAGFLAFNYLPILPRGNSGVLKTSGNIEVTDAQVSFKIPGRVETRPVDEGMVVQKGQVVATLEKADLKQEVELRKAELDAAQAALAKLVAGSREEEIRTAAALLQEAEAKLAELEAGSRKQQIISAEAAVQAANAEVTRTERDLARADRLLQTNSIPQENYDRAKTAFNVATQQAREAAEQLGLVREGPRQEQIEQVRAARNQAKAQYDMVKTGARKEDIDQARARVEQAKAALELAQTRLGYATIMAPMAGVVLSKNIEPGEYVAPGTPVITVGDLEDVWLRAYIPENQLGRVKVGQKARVTTDTYPGKSYEGRISFISQEAEFTPKNVQTEKERVKLVYRVKIDLANPSMELKPGMPADAEIVLDAAEQERGR
jgi:HlyD family secretion protein